MAPKIKRPKRCAKCKRLVREENKTGYCTGCWSNERARRIRKKLCFICEEQCSGKLQIKVTVNQTSPFCTYHFSMLNAIEDMKEIRKEIKRLKHNC